MAEYIARMDGSWEKTFAGEGVFYVYVLRRPSGAVFYVGKGKQNRIYDHEMEARRGHQCHKCHTIRKIWREGSQITKEIIFRTNIERDALRHEATLIQALKPQLVNVLDADQRLGGKYILRHARRLTKREKAEQRAARHSRAIQAINFLHDDLRYLRQYAPAFDPIAAQRIIEAQDAYRVWITRPEQERLEGF